MKNTLIFTIISLLLLFNLNFIIAQENNSSENCQDGICIVNYTEPELQEEIIDCENFAWVENYIKTTINETNTSINAISLIDIFKNANYNLQDDLNECNSKRNRYLFAFLFLFMIFIVFLLYFIIRSNKKN